MTTFFTKKTIFGIIIFIILTFGITGGVYLSQMQTQISSQASVPNYGSISVGPSVITKTSGSWPAVSIDVDINVPGANDSKTVAGVYVTQTQNVAANIGWTPTGNFYGSNGNPPPFNWTPSGNYAPGSYTFALFQMSGDSVVDHINTSGSIEFRDTVTKVCTPGFDAKECAVCKPDGSGYYGKKGSDFGNNPNSTEWCACAKNAVDYATSSTYSTCRGSNPVSTTCSDKNYGPESNHEAWCACAKIHSDEAFYQQKCGDLSGTCPVTASCCSSPLQKCGTTSTFNKTTNIDSSCPTGFQWCNGGYCISQSYSDSSKTCAAATTCSDKNYGPESNHEAWCACAKIHSDAAFYQQKCGGGTGGAPAPGATAADLTQSTDVGDGATCKYETFDDNLKPKPAITSGRSYRLKVYMKNTGTNTWDKDTYKLTTRDMSVWKVKDSYKLTDPERKITGNVGPNNEAIFEIPFTAPVVTRYETYPMYFLMTNAQGKWFGSACEPKEVQIQPEGAAPLATACYAISEDEAEITVITDCSDKTKVKDYTKDPLTIPYTLKNPTPGVKSVRTVYVRFISNNGTIKDVSKQITFAPNPTLTSISCTHSATGTGTSIVIRGTGFGDHSQQGLGYVRVKGQVAPITSWDGINNVVTATVSDRLEGDISVDLKIDDGRIVSGNCSVGISTIQFTVNTQCTVPGTFSAPGVDMRIVEATPGAKPLVSQKITLNKGVSSTFAPKIESGKKYSLILKAPKALIRKIDFTADSGTKNLGEIKLWLGDIAPRTAPDGKINSLDKSEMSREWSLISGGSAKAADLNDDGTVNSHDYSCQKLGFNQQNEASLSE